MRVGIFQILVILAFILLIVAPKQLPKLSKALGESIQEFKKGFKESNGNKE